MDKSQICALIPVYNAASHVAGVIRGMREEGVAVWVVNDGSTDDSAIIAKDAGAKVMTLMPNRGKGHALRKGFEAVLKEKFQWVLILDADGQHRPEESGLFIERASKGDVGMIGGNRLWQPKNMPKLRLWTNQFMSWLVSRMARTPIVDCQCGYKMMSRDFLEKAKLTADRFEIEDDLMLEAARLKVGIGVVPISSVYSTEVSHIHPWRDTVRFIKFLHAYQKPQS